MAKDKTIFICSNCGHNEPKWTGKCRMCGEWDTFVEEEVIQEEQKALGSVVSENREVLKLNKDIDDTKRIQTEFKELDRVLGGGLVNDEVILLSGDPGIGKSTILLQLTQKLSKNKSILYVSAEESVNQVSLRAKRLFKKDFDIDFLGNGQVDLILKSADKLHSDIVIVDSVQTIYDSDSSSLPGSLSQVKASVSKLVYYAKSKNKILILIGHITKEGSVAGPKVLEHLVDCVLQLEGHQNHEYRVLRSLKNRFGSTGEVGLFKMTSDGLIDDPDGATLFTLGSDKPESGVAKTMIIEGSRPIFVDVQALVNKTVYAYPKRVSEGLSSQRSQLITAILENQKVVSLADKDVYLRTSGGYKIKDFSYVDLAIAASIYSSSKNKKVDSSMVFVGEVSLNGKITTPSFLERYFDEILKTYPGFSIVTNKVSKKSDKIINISSLSEVKGLL